tara:strand:- start:1547 stop:1717 length:171 start_codon:yes stop_codon:yes gene_type:complete
MDKTQITPKEFAIKWLILGTFAIWFAIYLTGCNMVSGLGQDITAAAEGIRSEMGKD